MVFGSVETSTQELSFFYYKGQAQILLEPHDATILLILCSGSVKKDSSLEQLQHNFSCQLFTTHPNTVRNAMTTSLLAFNFLQFLGKPKISLSEEKKEELLAMSLQCHSINALKRIEERQ